MIASSNLCTYYFKTLMFWACEKKQSDFWSVDLLVQSVRELVIVMKKWVKAKFCMNYFIPGNNMMDHLIDADLYDAINALRRILGPENILCDVIISCKKIELSIANTTKKTLTRHLGLNEVLSLNRE